MPELSVSPDLSVVVPIHNEEDNLSPLVAEIHAALERTGKSFEIILVNDGSTDRSGERIDALASADPRVRVLHLERNFGQSAALSAGFTAARGAIILSLDGDLQNDPADLPRLVTLLEVGGYRVVSGWRKQRSEAKSTASGWLTRVLPSRLANALIATLCGLPSKDNGCSLKAYRSEVVKGVQLPAGMHRFVPAVFGVRPEEFAQVEVSHRPRRSGESHYGLRRIGTVLRDLLVLPFILRRRYRQDMLIMQTLMAAAVLMGLCAGGLVWSQPGAALVMVVVAIGLGACADCVRGGLERWERAQRDGVYRLRSSSSVPSPPGVRPASSSRTPPRRKVRI